MLRALCMTLVLSGLILPLTVRALDVPMGAETLFQQAEAANVVTTARFRSRSAESLVFDRDTLLAGSVGSTVVAKNDDYLNTVPLRPGAQYLLFLRADGDGRMSFPSSMYSVIEVGSTELPATLDALRSYLRDRTDRVRLEASLVRLASSDSTLIQTSAVTSLAYRQLVTRSNVGRLMELASSGRLRDPRARTLVVQQAGLVKAVEARAGLEARLLDAAENPGVREAALAALNRIDPAFVRAVMPRLQSQGVLQDRARSLLERSMAP
jgi:hypothetical protein